MFARELDDLAFGPVAIVSVGFGQKGTVAAVFGLDEADVWVGLNLDPSFGKDADKRIILGVQDQRRHVNAFDDPRRRRAMIIIIGAAKTETRRRNELVKIADGAHASESIHRVTLRKQFNLAPVAAHQPPQKLLLIDAVGGPMQRIDRGPPIDYRPAPPPAPNLPPRFPP